MCGLVPHDTERAFAIDDVRSVKNDRFIGSWPEDILLKVIEVVDKRYVVIMLTKPYAEKSEISVGWIAK